MADSALSIRLIARNEAQKAVNDALKDLKGLETQADATARHGEAMGHSLKAAAGMAAAAFAAVGVASFAVNAIKAASDVSESASKVGVVFGESAGAIEAFAATAARDLGMSRGAALEATGSFGALFAAMKLAPSTSADMSTGLVKLAADLASFNNLEGGAAEAAEKLRAGLVGETEPLRALGVNLTAASIASRAAEMGFKKINGEFDAGAKAQAAYSLILEQTQTAQGDFARTSTGLANAQRILGASLENITAEIGGAFLPIVASAVSWLAGALPGAFETAKDAVKPFTDRIALVGDIIDTLSKGEGFDRLYAKINETLGEPLGAIIAIPIDFLARLRAGGDETTAGLTSGFDAIKAAVGDMVDFFVPKVQEAIATVTGWAQSLDPALTAVVSRVVAFIVGEVTAFVAFWSRHWGDVQAVLTAAWQVIEGTVRAAWSLVSGIIKAGLQVLSGDWKGAWETMKGALSAAGEGIKQAAKGTLDGLIALVKGFGPDLVAWFTKPFRDAWAQIEGLLGKIGDGIRGLPVVGGMVRATVQAARVMAAPGATAARLAADVVQNVAVPGGDAYDPNMRMASTANALRGALRDAGQLDWVNSPEAARQLAAAQVERDRAADREAAARAQMAAQQRQQAAIRRLARGTLRLDAVTGGLGLATDDPDNPSLQTRQFAAMVDLLTTIARKTGATMDSFTVGNLTGQTMSREASLLGAAGLAFMH